MRLFSQFSHVVDGRRSVWSRTGEQATFAERKQSEAKKEQEKNNSQYGRPQTIMVRSTVFFCVTASHHPLRSRTCTHAQLFRDNVSVPILGRESWRKWEPQTEQMCWSEFRFPFYFRREVKLMLYWCTSYNVHSCAHTRTSRFREIRRSGKTRETDKGTERERACVCVPKCRHGHSEKRTACSARYVHTEYTNVNKKMKQTKRWRKLREMRRTIHICIMNRILRAHRPSVGSCKLLQFESTRTINHL